jgi:cyanophycinase
MTEGHVIVIGGAEDKVRERVILTRFVALAGGPDARIAVISTATSLGPLAGEMYRRIFTELGAREVHPIHAMTRAQASDPAAARVVRDSTGVFMTGGNQLRLSSTIGGTALAQAVVKRHREGAVVAGTSAGASAMSSHMVAFGASGATPKQRMVQMAAGLGILPGVIIDQHFEQRNRLGRLLAIIAQNPSLLGIGIDEDTAGVVGPDMVLEIIGRRSVTIIDGASSETDAWEVKAHKPLMISNVVLHSLPAGYRFDLERRQRLPAAMLRAIEPDSVASS